MSLIVATGIKYETKWIDGVEYIYDIRYERKNADDLPVKFRDLVNDMQYTIKALHGKLETALKKEVSHKVMQELTEILHEREMERVANRQPRCDRWYPKLRAWVNGGREKRVAIEAARKHTREAAMENVIPTGYEVNSMGSGIVQVDVNNTSQNHTQYVWRGVVIRG